MGNAKIAGSGTISGGKYDQVKISGSGKINGDVEAKKIKISGSGKVNGTAQVDEFKISGSGKIDGSFTGGRFVVSGSGKVTGHMQATEVKVSGSFTCKDSLICHTVRSSGTIKVYGDVESELFQTSGGFHVEGLINANDVQVKIYGHCYAKEIGGETISIRKKDDKYGGGGLISRIYRLLFGGELGVLKAEIIEGTQVSVEGTEAKVVRGEQVVIGPHCRIDRVEYTDTLEIDERATVLSYSKV